MDPSKDELAEELAHEQKILKIRRRNLRALEEQEANFGLDVPIHIKGQISESKEYIQGHEKRINDLEITLAEGDISVSEVEYKMHLADVWNTLEKYPRSVYLYRLDFVRLRLHITPERAKELELEIRYALAIDLVREVSSNREFYGTFRELIGWMCGKGTLSSGFSIRTSAILLPFWRMLFLDPGIAVGYIMYELEHYMRELKIHRVYHFLRDVRFLDESDKECLKIILSARLGSKDEEAYKQDMQLDFDELFPE